ICAHELRNLGELTRDIDFYLLKAGNLAVVESVQTDSNAVGAQRIAGLLDDELGVLAVFLLIVCGQGVYTRGLEPLLSPEGQVAPRCFLQMAKQIIEGGVVPRVLSEMAANASEEVLAAHISLQLLEYRSALGIGDAVKVLFNGFNIGSIRGNRVRGGELILLISPGLFDVGESDPGGVVLSIFCLRNGR